LNNKKILIEGREAYKHDQSIKDCPYTDEMDRHIWISGWNLEKETIVPKPMKILEKRTSFDDIVSDGISLDIETKFTNYLNKLLKKSDV